MARKIFELHGVLSILGIEDAEKKLKAIDKEAIKVSKSINRFVDDISSVGKQFSLAFTAPIVAATAAIAAVVTKTADYADELLDLTEITGMSSDTLQELEHVALSVGVEFGTLTQSVQAFTGKLPKILKEGGTAAKVIKDLGVNVKDTHGNLRSMDDIFPELITALQGVENKTLRNSMAQQILGKDLSALAPVLGITADEFNRLRKEAHDTGVVMSGENLETAADFKSEINLLNKQFQMLAMNFAVDIIPLLRDDLFPIIKNDIIPVIKVVIEKVVGWAKAFSNLSPGTKKLLIKLTGVLAILGPLAIGIGSLTTAIAAMIPVIVSLGAALLANPIYLLAAAVAGVTIAMYAAAKSAKSFQENIVDPLNTRQLKEQKDALEELIELYSEVEDMSTTPTTLDRASVVDKRIKELETNMGSYGYDSSGSATDKKARAFAQLDKIAPIPVQPGEQTLTEDTEDPAIKQYENRRKALDAIIQLEEDYAEKSFNVNATEQQKLDRLYTRALVEADNIGASKVDIEKWYASETVKLQDEAAQKQIDTIKELEEATLSAKIASADGIDAINAAELEQLRYKQAEEISLYKEGSYEYLLIKQKQSYEIIELTKKQKDKELELEKETSDKKLKTVMDYFGMVQDLGNGIFDFFSGMNENKELELDNNYTRELDRINSLNVTEAERNKLIQDLDAQTDKKKKELKQKQARLDKAAAIFQIGMSTAQGIMQAWATNAWPVATALTVLIGLLGAAQTAVVASKPIPAAKGAMVESSPGRGAIMQVGEGYQDEVVLPLQSGIKAIVAGMMMEMGKLTGGTTIYNNSNTSTRPVYLTIGTLVADDTGLKELENRMSRVRVLEAQRMGAMI